MQSVQVRLGDLNRMKMNSTLDVLATILFLSVRHRVQKTGKSRSLKKFGYTQDNALILGPIAVHFLTALVFTLEYTVPLV